MADETQEKKEAWAYVDALTLSKGAVDATVSKWKAEVPGFEKLQDTYEKVIQGIYEYPLAGRFAKNKIPLEGEREGEYQEGMGKWNSYVVGAVASTQRLNPGMLFTIEQVDKNLQNPELVLDSLTDRIRAADALLRTNADLVADGFREKFDPPLPVTSDEVATVHVYRDANGEYSLRIKAGEETYNLPVIKYKGDTYQYRDENGHIPADKQYAIPGQVGISLASGNKIAWRGFQVVGVDGKPLKLVDSEGKPVVNDGSANLMDAFGAALSTDQVERAKATEGKESQEVVSYGSAYGKEAIPTAKIKPIEYPSKYMKGFGPDDLGQDGFGQLRFLEHIVGRTAAMAATAAEGVNQLVPGDPKVPEGALPQGLPPQERPKNANESALDLGQDGFGQLRFLKNVVSKTVEVIAVAAGGGNSKAPKEARQDLFHWEEVPNPADSKSPPATQQGAPKAIGPKVP